MTPASEAEVVEAVREARARQRSLEIVGAGTKRDLGRPMRCDDVLETSGLKGIVCHEPEELLITMLPGTPVREAVEVLAAKGQRLGFAPADWGPLFGAEANAATVGGAISADASGAAAMRFGRARDHLLAFRAVNGLGEAYKAGGKVVKNVTGFDLPKLMCGAMGTLGVLTEVTLRVFPKPDVSAVFAVPGLSVADGLGLLRTIWRSPLDATGLALVPDEVVHLEAIRMTTPRAAPANGAIVKCVALLRLEGSPASLVEKRLVLNAILDGHPLTEIEDGHEMPDGLSAGAPFVDRPGDVWLLGVPPSTCATVADRVAGPWVADWAGGRLWVGVAPGDAGAWLREAAMAASGSAMLVRASEETRLRIAPFQPEPPACAALTRAVKAAFDPMGLFNPGRMYEGV